MKTKPCLFALCLISAILPVTTLGAEMDKDGGSGGSRVQMMRIPRL